LSFRIQFIGGQYRTVVLGHKAQSDIICTEVSDLIDFSPLAPTPDAGWNPSLLDKYAFMLRNELTFTADEAVFIEIQTLLADIDNFKNVDAKALFAIIKKGKFSLNDVPKANQHPKLVFDAIKAGNRITKVTAKSYSLFIKFRGSKEAEDGDDEITELEDTNFKNDSDVEFHARLSMNPKRRFTKVG